MITVVESSAHSAGRNATPLKTSSRERMAVSGARIAATLHTARILAGAQLDATVLARHRELTVKAIRKRAAAVAGQRPGRVRDATHRYGLALRRRMANSITTDLAAQPAHREEGTVGAIADPERDGPFGPTQERTHFAVAISTSLDLRKVKILVSRELGFESVSSMERAGVSIDTSMPDEAALTFTVSLPRRPGDHFNRAIAAKLRTALNADRVVAVSSLTDPRFQRRLAKIRARAQDPASDDPNRATRCTCECCCRPEREPPGVVHHSSGAARPTWAGIPDDTEWHLKQMRVKEAWAIKPQPGGHSRGAGIVIAHPDTGWREHAEFDEDRMRFDLARNVRLY